MVPNAASWVWSSYRSIVDATSPPWLETDWILGQFANERTQAQQEYVAFVDTGVTNASVWKDLRHQIFLGDEFVESFVKTKLKPKALLEFTSVPNAKH